MVMTMLPYPLEYVPPCISFIQAGASVRLRHLRQTSTPPTKARNAIYQPTTI